jgi:exosortase
MSEPTVNQSCRPTTAQQAPVQTLGQLPHLKALLVVLLAWIALFHFVGNSTLGYVRTPSLFGWWSWTMSGISDQDLGYLMPFVVPALLWYRREHFAALPARVFWPSLALVVAAVLIHLLGYLIQQTRISVIAFFLGVYGISGLFWGGPWLRNGFLPFSLLVFSVPLGPGVETLTFPLRLLATKITAVLCRTGLGIDVIQNGNVLLDSAGQYQYEVAAACSGIRSLTSLLVFGGILAYLSFRKTWKRLAVILIAIPMAVVANVARLTLIIIAAEIYGQSAGNFVHENWFFSLLPYAPAIAGMLLFGHWLREDKDKDREKLKDQDQARPAENLPLQRTADAGTSTPG